MKPDWMPYNQLLSIRVSSEVNYVLAVDCRTSILADHVRSKKKNSFTPLFTDKYMQNTRLWGGGEGVGTMSRAHIEYLPFAIDASDQCHIAQLSIIEICSHISQCILSVIGTLKIFILLTGGRGIILIRLAARRCKAGQTEVTRQCFIIL